MTANELDLKVMELVNDYDVTPVLQHLGRLGEGQYKEVQNTNDRANLYYQWLACLMKLLKPQQVVELGAAAGISTVMMASELPLDAKLISVDIDPQIAWKWMDRDYPQVIKVLGDDLDLSIYPKEIDLSKTDVWFIDSLHTEEQLRKELELYTPFFKKGAVLVFDDIHVPGLDTVWNTLPYDKHDISNPCHWQGFGVAIV